VHVYGRLHPAVAVKFSPYVLNTAIFWVVTRCALVKFHQHFKTPAVFIINPDDGRSYHHGNGVYHT